MTKQLCIICSQPCTMTVEHVYPQAIGGGFELSNVCKSCNNHLGEYVDNALTDHLLIKLKRFSLKIPGQKGTVPNPITSTSEDEQGYKSVFETNREGDIKGFRQLPRIRDLGDNKFEFSVDNKDSKLLLPMIKKHLLRKGITPPPDNVLLASTMTRESASTVSHNFKGDAIEFHRPVVKIAFELALAWLGEAYLADDTAMRIKDFLFDKRTVAEIDAAYRIEGQITLQAPTSPGLDYCWDEVWRNEEHLHIGMLHPDSTGLWAMIRIFNTVYGSVRLSPRAEWPGVFPRLIVLDSLTRKYSEFAGQSQIAVEMHRQATLKNNA
ncbi:MAG: HNH endonuclease [Candidatus Melainabacteria bacterium]|nr:HNH endonuclease [Candidatus Melainabacteria bacterium]